LITYTDNSLNTSVGLNFLFVIATPILPFLLLLFLLVVLLHVFEEMLKDPCFVTQLHDLQILFQLLPRDPLEETC